MLRRGVSLLLVPMVLLSQWAGVGHCHADDQPHGHGSVPHVHLGVSHLWSDHADHDADHDADAVYLPVGAWVGALPAPPGPDAPAADPAGPVPAGYFTPVRPPPALTPARPHPPPRPHPGGCPRYLRLLTLLI